MPNPTTTTPQIDTPTRPMVDPGTYRQPGQICPQQSREEAWEVM